MCAAVSMDVLGDIYMCANWRGSVIESYSKPILLLVLVLQEKNEWLEWCCCERVLCVKIQVQGWLEWCCCERVLCVKIQVQGWLEWCCCERVLCVIIQVQWRSPRCWLTACFIVKLVNVSKCDRCKPFVGLSLFAHWSWFANGFVMTILLKI